MKKFIAILALVTGLAAIAPSSAEARETRGSSHRHGVSSHHGSHYQRSPLVRVRVRVGYRHGRPVYAWRYVKRSSYYGHNHGSSYGSSHSRSYRR